MVDTLYNMLQDTDAQVGRLAVCAVLCCFVLWCVVLCVRSILVNEQGLLFKY